MHRFGRVYRFLKIFFYRVKTRVKVTHMRVFTIRFSNIKRDFVRRVFSLWFSASPFPRPNRCFILRPDVYTETFRLFVAER